MPCGLWWAGVSSTAGTSNSSRSSTTAPCSSTPIGTVGTPSAAMRVAEDEQPVGLDGDRAADDPCQQFDRMPDARADHDRLRRCAHAARPWQVFGERVAQFGPAAWIAHPQRLGGRVGQGPAGGGHPFGARKLGHVGRAGHQVVRRNDAHTAGPCGHACPAGVDHPGACALPRRQPALGDQFGVCLGDGVAGQSEVGGQAARRRQHGARAPAGRIARRRAGR